MDSVVVVEMLRYKNAIEAGSIPSGSNKRGDNQTDNS